MGMEIWSKPKRDLEKWGQTGGGSQKFDMLKELKQNENMGRGVEMQGNGTFGGLIAQAELCSRGEAMDPPPPP